MLSIIDTNRSHARLRAMRGVQRALVQPESIDQLCRAVRRELGEAVCATGFVLGLYDQPSQTVEVVHQTDSGNELPGGVFPLARGFMSDVIRKREPRLIRHWTAEGPRVQVQYATDKPGLPESTITVPLLIGDRAIGVLSLQSYAIGAFDEDDLLLVQAVAAQIAPALQLLQERGTVQAAHRATALEAVIASMTEGLLVLDHESRIVSINPPARAVFGPVGAGIVLGQRLDREQWGQWPLGAQAVAEALVPVLEALARGEAQHDIQVELNSEGRRVLSFSSAPLCDGSGGSIGGVVVFRDVTTERDVARLKDELLSIASHDLRTPVTVLKGQAQLMERTIQTGTDDGPKLLQRVHTMAEQTDRLSSMLNTLLDLSRVEAGRLDLKEERTDLKGLVERAVMSARLLSTKHEFQIVAPPSVDAVVDVARLNQVLQNLLTNAIKYAPQGGPVIVNLEADAHSVTVSVRDRGLGIPAEELPHLFQRFYRMASTRKLEGSGLGLYICQGIVAAHGGRMWAHSDGPGQGSTFMFTLPRERTAEVPS